MGCGCTKNAAVDAPARQDQASASSDTGLEGAENEFTAVSSPGGTKGGHPGDDINPELSFKLRRDADAHSRYFVII